MAARTRLLLLAALVAICLGAAALGVPHSPDELRTLTTAFGLASPLVALGAWVVLTPALFSGTVLALVGGLAFGLRLGFGVGLAGATLGGVAAFVLARRLGHSAVQELSGDRLRRLQARVERRGWLAVAGVRAAPGVPATLLNYACGLSRIRLRDFVAGSALGGAPRVFAYTAVGASGGHLSSLPALAGLAVVIAMALVGLSIIIVRLRRRGIPAAA